MGGLEGIGTGPSDRPERRAPSEHGRCRLWHRRAKLLPTMLNSRLRLVKASCLRMSPCLCWSGGESEGQAARAATQQSVRLNMPVKICACFRSIGRGQGAEADLGVQVQRPALPKDEATVFCASNKDL